ncbi:hypothetical protein AVL63_04670 [Nesterenkonia jeotgali]|uniref:Acyltransferase n=2 Tax=Nesterenkonia jeotgali TaxID=317018 RepID=A0A0W8ICZ5_9MICC|nr:acyltransferase family protein [Nesterenkonia jeotgali]KUG57820.1 hypothetical protein AVL63_04670 [Nesterenkonia jeotgali]
MRRLPERRFRPELHGVRGLAILGVVLFHLFGAGRISGGIDIFLAVSGFLFTGMLLREAASSGGTINVGRYLARLARRLLPPAAIVVGVTLVVGLLLFPTTRHEQLWGEARASLLYFENIELINSQLAYGAAGPDTSPFQHFWSLSVQGQFYLVWPVVAIASVLIARRLRRPAAGVFGVIVCLIIVVSFVFTLHMQSLDQDQAYLMTRTRFWELAFGGLLALVGSSLVLPRSLRIPAGWLGLGLIVSCGFVLDGAALFPGPWALWPLAGLTLVMLSANRSDDEGSQALSSTRFLSSGFLAWIGNIAYGLYLWHWPLLIFYLEFRGREAVGPRGASGIFAVSVILAWFTHRLIEKPVSRTTLGQRTQLVSAGGLLVGAGVASSIVLTQLAPEIPEGYSMSGVDRNQYPGAADLDQIDPSGDGNSSIYPSLDSLSDDRSMYYSWGCHQSHENRPDTGEVKVCEDPHPPANPEKTVMLAGGSHAGHWYNGLLLIAEKNNWELLVADKDGCRFRHTEDLETDACSRWNNQFPEVVQERGPDLVVTTGSTIGRSGSTESISNGAQDRWREIRDSGSELLLIRGTARPDEDVPECLASESPSRECGPDFASFADTNPLSPVVEDWEGVETIDLTPQICPSKTCPAVIGNVPVYRDGSHLSSYYVETLAPHMDQAIRDSFPEFYE